MDKKISIPITTFSISDSVLKDAIEKKLNASGGGVTPTSGTGAMDSITIATSVPAQKKSPAPKELGRSRGMCWTLYNYEKYVADLEKEVCQYIVYGYEVCPDTGRPHLQGYVYYKNPQSLGEFSKRYGECHIEKQRGTAKEASDYCKYDDYPTCTKLNRYVERGVLPKQGQRTDWGKAVEDLREKDVIDVILEQPQLAPSQRALREIKAMYLKPLHRDVEVIVVYGEAGAGKSRWAYDHYPDLYKKPVGEWWDGYTGQKAVLLDDFYGWIKYHDLLHILDRYPLNVPVKGGFVWAQWNVVIITSNDAPPMWYKDKGLTPALRRRLKKVMYVESIDGKASYVPQEDYQAQNDASS